MSKNGCNSDTAWKDDFDESNLNPFCIFLWLQPLNNFLSNYFKLHQYFSWVDDHSRSLYSSIFEIIYFFYSTVRVDGSVKNTMSYNVCRYAQ